MPCEQHATDPIDLSLYQLIRGFSEGGFDGFLLPPFENVWVVEARAADDSDLWVGLLQR